MISCDHCVLSCFQDLKMHIGSSGILSPLILQPPWSQRLFFRIAGPGSGDQTPRSSLEQRDSAPWQSGSSASGIGSPSRACPALSCLSWGPGIPDPASPWAWAPMIPDQAGGKGWPERGGLTPKWKKKHEFSFRTYKERNSKFNSIITFVRDLGHSETIVWYFFLLTWLILFFWFWRNKIYWQMKSSKQTLAREWFREYVVKAEFR